MAGGSAKPEEGKKKARIEIIPLIDVIFFLLATFVLFMLSLNRIQSMPLQLPVSNSTPAPPNPDDVTIQVADGDSIYWNRDLKAMGELPALLRGYKGTVREPHILIAGESEAKVGPTLHVLDEIRIAGIEQVSVETKDREPGR